MGTIWLMLVETTSSQVSRIFLGIDKLQKQILTGITVEIVNIFQLPSVFRHEKLHGKLAKVKSNQVVTDEIVFVVIN